ncbi:MFS transporter [Paraburkholderia saeva]|uniref:Inner membrane transport protein YnfM n=1 Tax=Paraburkholderia saeva TaxID=2777537 RepID=A0A9N8RUG1_9BURK|nr:MFS transporter [Paraburkholderia saeva]CAG4891916.1 Inner membrane transport protein YnfM [Paraburkholderia saeva]CAG4905838.1 Inner membrane transport protein YnfM [Paraburkholderia saeva]CAG4919557.1 Inner membrane transport protein YnfM [Paraburkholderia saeva]
MPDPADPSTAARSASSSSSASPAQGHSSDNTASTPYLERGTRTYWRASLALLFAGYATFSLLYCVQPLLPAFSTTFGVSPAQSSFSLSLTTTALAFAIFVAGFVSEGWSRHRLMTASLTASSVLTLAVAFAPQWHQLLVLRALEGLALGGVPAVAMAYLAEEVHPDGLGLAMGLYVGGTAIGGMAGRVITGVVANLSGWRVSVAVIGVLGLVAMLAFRTLLPPSRHFVPRRGLGFSHHRAALAKHFATAGLPVVFLMAFVLMGSFVTLYNYIGYRLLAPPYQLSQAEISSIFVVYLTGVVASPWSGRMADTFGRARVLIASLLLMLTGAGLTMLQPIAAIAAGIACLTFGFFAGHAVASGWVGRMAKTAKGHAAALYLLAYYLGSSVVGSYGGHVWARHGWNGVVLLVALLLVCGIAGAWWLRTRERKGLA